MANLVSLQDFLRWMDDDYAVEHIELSDVAFSEKVNQQRFERGYDALPHVSYVSTDSLDEALAALRVITQSKEQDNE